MASDARPCIAASSRARGDRPASVEQPVDRGRAVRLGGRAARRRAPRGASGTQHSPAGRPAARTRRRSRPPRRRTGVCARSKLTCVAHARLDARVAAEREHRVVVARVRVPRVQQQRLAAQVGERGPAGRRARWSRRTSTPWRSSANRAHLEIVRPAAGSARGRGRSSRRGARRRSRPAATRSVAELDLRVALGERRSKLRRGLVAARSPRRPTTRPRSPRRSAARCATARRRAPSSAGPALSRNSPASVSSTEWVVRRSSSTPSSCSSSRTCRLSAGWATCRRLGGPGEVALAGNGDEVAQSPQVGHHTIELQAVG